MPILFPGHPLLTKLGWGTIMSTRETISATNKSIKYILRCTKIQQDKYANENSPFTEMITKNMVLAKAFSRYLENEIKHLDDKMKAAAETDQAQPIQHEESDREDWMAVFREVRPLISESTDIFFENEEIRRTEAARKEKEKEDTSGDKATVADKTGHQTADVMAAFYQRCREHNKALDRGAEELRKKIQRPLSLGDKVEAPDGQEKSAQKEPTGKTVDSCDQTK